MRKLLNVFLLLVFTAFTSVQVAHAQRSQKKPVEIKIPTSPIKFDHVAASARVTNVAIGLDAPTFTKLARSETVFVHGQELCRLVDDPNGWGRIMIYKLTYFFVDKKGAVHYTQQDVSHLVKVHAEGSAPTRCTLQNGMIRVAEVQL